MELYESPAPDAVLPETEAAQAPPADIPQPSDLADEPETAAIPAPDSGDAEAALPETTFSLTEEPEMGSLADAPDIDDEGFAPSEESRVRVKFNKKEHAFTPTEAAPLVEMGMKWEQFRPHHEKLRYLAQESGQSVGELIDTLLRQSDDRLREQLRQECDGSDAAAARLLEIRQTQRQQQFEQAGFREAAEARVAAEQEQTTLEQRLADEFVRLTDEMPGQFAAFTDVPAEAVALAVSDDLPLLDAYLRHAFYEQRRAQAVRQQQALSASRSAGSLGSAGLAPEPDMDSFERAFYSALR